MNNSRLASFTILIGAAALSLGLSAFAATGHGPIVLAALLVSTVFVLGLMWNVGVVIGALLLAQLGGIPGLHPSKSLETGFLIIELAVMIGFLANRRRSRGTVQQFAYVASAACLAWWFLVALLTVLLNGGTLGGVLAGGRDLAYIPVLAPISMLVFRDARLRRGFLGTAAVGVGAFLIARLSYGFGLYAAKSFLSIDFTTNVEGGLVRVYSAMSVTQMAAAALGLALAIRGTTPSARLIGWFFAVTGVTAIIVNQTRAEYFGLGVGLVVGIGGWLLQSSKGSERLARRRVGWISGSLVLVALVITLTAPSLNDQSPAGKLVSRTSEGLSNLTQGTGTIAVRENTSDTILRALGSNWPWGLGFRSPSERYFSGVLAGDIRNYDVGVLNLYATEGLIGVFLLFVPLLTLLIALLVFLGRGHSQPVAISRNDGEGRAPIRDASQDVDWLSLGLVIWLTGTIVSSITLVTLFSRFGCTFSGLMLGLALAVLSSTSGYRPRTM